MNENPEKPVSRRHFLRNGLQFIAGIATGGLAVLLGRKESCEYVWQLDPDLCVHCEKCATHCVLPQSAVKVVHTHAMCGYCDLCSGYLVPGAKSRDTGAENQMCPTGAIERKFIEDPYFEYNINEDLCIGCGKCARGCGDFGNGSLYLQVRHDRCVNCNDCSIARVCPSQAFSRVPAKNPYILRGNEKV